MKIRIHGNTLRLRLSKSEIARFCDRGWVLDQIEFPSGSQLTYQIKWVEQPDKIRVTYDQRNITVLMNREMGETWCNSDEKVGIYEQVALREGKILDIRIEKDYQCLTPRAGEDEADLFTHPMAKQPQ